ncbi:MAG TPA: PIN domain-containing protein [Gemmatimonadales bacterium]|nr:PIN domain-containing protein [Gemmatimonadales bacterium]
MIAYIDSSVVLRLVLGQAGALREWRTLDRGVASALVEVETLRTLDRLRLAEGLAEPELVERRAAVYRLMETLEIVEPTRLILRRASQPLPVSLGTLDAIHLATALAWRDANNTDLTVATHDAQLGLAARALGLDAVGV